MKIVLIGFKSCGKTAVGKMLATKLGKQFIDLDDTISELYSREKRETLSCREIYKKHGKEFFRTLEATAVNRLAKKNDCVIALGGGTLTNHENAKAIKKNSKMVYIKDSAENLLKRIKERGIPAFLDANDLDGSMKRELAKRVPIYENYADITIDSSKLTVEQIVEATLNVLKTEMHTK